MEYVEKSLDAFFQAGSAVLVIKGDWGVGKTYFWENYINRRIKNRDLSQIAYSYVSLFGKNSLADIKASIFQNSRAIASNEEVIDYFSDELKNSNLLYTTLAQVKSFPDYVKKFAPKIGRFSSSAKKIPGFDKFSSLMSSAEYSLVSNYVVCFDDIERKGSALSVKELMGLADELAQRKHCKVVLVFNEKSFDKDGKDLEHFESYREKVVDVEILYSPTCEMNFKHVFGSDMDQFDFLKSVVLRIGVRNVRVLRKLKTLLNAHASFLKDKDKGLVREFYLHASVLCLSYYLGKSFIDYVDLRRSLAGGSWAKYLTASAENLTEGEMVFKNINIDLQMSESKFDSPIGSFLECGYIDEVSLSTIFSEVQERYRKSNVDAQLRDAWKIYHDSFEDNAQEFRNRIKQVLNEHLKLLSLSDLSSAIDMLELLGETVDGYIENYMSFHSESFKAGSDSSSWHLERIKNEKLRSKVIEAEESNRNFNIDEIALRIATNRAWGPEDVTYLASLTSDDYVSWIHSVPENLTIKLRSGLLSLGGVSTPDPDDHNLYAKIAGMVWKALEVIGSENEFNMIRLKNMYGMKPE